METSREPLYNALEPSARQFRLLRLIECGPEAIKCEFATFALPGQDTPPWKALSYRWGEDDPCHTIYLNNHAISVRKNLYTFLAQMLAEKRRDWFFVDALCINQEDETEKTSQVRQMRDVYHKADEVLAWIVPDDKETDDVQAEKANMSIIVTPSSRAECEAAVIENSYWSRLWPIQEILQAKLLTVRIGSAEIDWTRLVPEKNMFQSDLPARNEVLSRSSSVSDTITNEQNAKNILSYRRFMGESLRTGHHIAFHKAVDFFGMQHCGRPHDKVFGYLGLTNSRIQVDYAMPVLDLFVATLADYLLSAGFITEDLKPLRKRWQAYHISLPFFLAHGLGAPLLAFDMDPYTPVVNLLVQEVARFFASGLEQRLMNHAVLVWWRNRRSEQAQAMEEEFEAFGPEGDGRVELSYIGPMCVRMVKGIVTDSRAYGSALKAVEERQKWLGREDAAMHFSGTGETKTYSEWAAYTRVICEQMWQRYQQSGEDAQGDLDDDEAWTLIA